MSEQENNEYNVETNDELSQPVYTELGKRSRGNEENDASESLDENVKKLKENDDDLEVDEKQDNSVSETPDTEFPESGTEQDNSVSVPDIFAVPSVESIADTHRDLESVQSNQENILNNSSLSVPSIENIVNVPELISLPSLESINYQKNEPIVPLEGSSADTNGIVTETTGPLENIVDELKQAKALAESQLSNIATEHKSKYIFPLAGNDPTSGLAVLEIVPSKVGQIIGSKGAVIIDIQNRSGAKVVVDQNFPEGVNRQLKITGNPVQVKNAIDLISKVCEEGALSINAIPSGPNSITTVIDCLPAHVGRVIGGSGQVIKEIQQRTGAKVHVDQNFPDGVNRKVTVSGDPHSVSAAAQLVYYAMEHGPKLPPVQTVAHAPQQIPSHYGPSPYSVPAPNGTSYPSVYPTHQSYSVPAFNLPAQSPYTPSNPSYQHATPSYTPPASTNQTKIIEIQKQFVGRIIGKGGSHIVAIGKQSGCTLKVEQDTEPCRLIITGPPTGIPIAEMFVQEVMLNIKNPVIMNQQNATAPHVTATPTAAPTAYSVAVPNYYSLSNGQPQQHHMYNHYSVPQPQELAHNPYPYPYAATTSTSMHVVPSYATAPAPTPAPRPESAWAEYKTDEGRSYWHNPTTGVTQWNRPN